MNEPKMENGTRSLTLADAIKIKSGDELVLSILSEEAASSINSIIKTHQQILKEIKLMGMVDNERYSASYDRVCVQEQRASTTEGYVGVGAYIYLEGKEFRIPYEYFLMDDQLAEELKSR